MMQLTNQRANIATGRDLKPGPCLRRVGAQGVAPRWFERGQAPSGWRPGGSGEGRCPVGGAQPFCQWLFEIFFNINDDDDDANARSDLTMQLELQNQNESTILE